MFIVQKNEQGQRLDKFLVGKLPGYSRSQIQKLIKNGLVLINNRPTTVHHFLKEKDKIQLVYPKKETEQLPEDDLKIIYQDNNFLVINKPAGLLVHPTQNYEKNTLVNLILEKYPEIKNVGDLQRPGIVHRLDKEVSGLMVIAKTQKGFDTLKEQFQNRLIYKEYLALVHGKLPKEEGAIDFPIGYSVDSSLRAAHPLKNKKEKFDQHDKEAVTEYEVVRRIKNYTLVKVKIRTGRTHQIRVHFKSIGYPIVGDKIYHLKRFFQIFQKKKDKINRPFLHATKLGFYDLNNNFKTFESELPIELKNYLSQIDA